MNHKISHRIQFKSNGLGLLLFCLLFFVGLGCVEGSSEDTIRIDGRLVVIEKVSADHFNDGPIDSPFLPRKELGNFFVRAELNTGLNSNTMRYTGNENLSTLNDFINRKSLWSTGVGIGLQAGVQLNNKWSIWSGLSLNSGQVKSNFFEEGELLTQEEAGYDEFIGFYSSSQGELFQVVRFINDIAFKDSSIVIGIQENKANYLDASIPIQLRRDFAKRSQSRWSFHVSGGPVLYFRNQQEHLSTYLLNDEGRLEKHEISKNDFSTFSLGGMARVGCELDVNSKMRLYAALSAERSIGNRLNSNSLIDIHHLNTSINLGVHWSLSKKG